MAQSDKEVLNLYQLIGAPLLAVVQAEAQAAQVSAEFIKQIGFETAPRRPAANAAGPAAPAPATPVRALEEGGDIGNLRMVQFLHRMRGTDGLVRTHQMQVPVLSLFPIPLLQVKDAEFDFAIRVLDHETRGPQLPGGPPSEKVIADDRTEFLNKNRVELKGTIGRRQSSGSERSTDMQLNVKIRMEQADMPVGLLKLLTVLDQSISTTPAPIDAAPAPPADAKNP